MKTHQIVETHIIHLTLQILQEKLHLKPSDLSLTTSSTPAASVGRRRQIEGHAATIGRLQRAVTAIATACI